MVRAIFPLGLLSSPVFAHPGHAALEIHWHLDDIAWVLLAALVVLGVGYLIARKRKP
jgi:heme/copper-type cytochrome/quinol oxidase subunit 3